MKTSEFIKQVEELGYVTNKDNWYVYVRNKRFIVAMVSETRVNAIDANYSYADVPNKLFDLIVEYAKTPLEDREEREEPKRYYELLNELGVKEEQWVPEYTEWYWVTMDTGEVGDSRWENDVADNYRLLMNNVFKTEEEAEAQRDFDIKKAKLIKEIEDSSDVIDWDDVEQNKYSLYYDHYGEEININSCRQNELEGPTYTTNREFLENLIKNEPERVKKYLFRIGE